MCLEQQHTERWGTVADLVIHIQTHILKAELDARYLASEHMESIPSTHNQLTQIQRYLQ